MLKKTTCPVCGAQWNEGVYDVCPNCGWVVGTDASEKKKEIEKKEEEEKKKGEAPVADKFPVNSRAENVADTVASIVLILGWIIGIIAVIAGIALVAKEGTAYISLAIGGVVYILLAYVLWAFIKMFVNISRNLFSINESLKKK